MLRAALCTAAYFPVRLTATLCCHSNGSLSKFIARNITVSQCFDGSRPIIFGQQLKQHRLILGYHGPLPATSHWCAEVNASPSLSTDTAADHQLKWGLVQDALTLVDVDGKLEGQLPSSFGGYAYLIIFLV